MIVDEARPTDSSLVNDAPRARVIRSLKQWIDEGVLPPGQVIPPERTLAETLKVNRGTIRRALAVLDEEGVLYSNGGRTRFVSAPATTTRSFMQDSIAVLTPFRTHAASERETGGLLEYISQGALWAIHNSGRHVIALHPSRLNQTEINRLSREIPLGVVIPDTKMDFTHTMDLASALQNAGVRVVVYGGSPNLENFDRVASDQEAGAYELTRWLVAQGRTSILPVWAAPAEGYWFAQRYSGYKRACLEAGLEALSPLIVPPFPVCNGDKTVFESGVRHWVGYFVDYLNRQQPVDALMMSTDSDVFGAAAACRLLGKTPGEDVALVGYDNYWTTCAERSLETFVPQATIDKSNFELGENLVKLLLERIGGQLPPVPQLRVVSPQLVITGSDVA